MCSLPRTGGMGRFPGVRPPSKLDIASGGDGVSDVAPAAGSLVQGDTHQEQQHHKQRENHLIHTPLSPPSVTTTRTRKDRALYTGQPGPCRAEPACPRTYSF